MTPDRTPPPLSLPRFLGWVLARALPATRRDEVLGDLEESYARRTLRLGPARARRLLWKEAAALLLWRLRAVGTGLGVRSAIGSEGLDDEGNTGSHLKGTGTMMGRDLLRDLRFGARTLLRQPGFTLVAVAVMGLGIGAPTTVLTLVNRIFFDAPPQVTEPHRLVRVWRSWAPGQGGGSLQHPDFAYYRENATTLDGLAAWGGGQTATYTLDGTGTDQLQVQPVTDNYFQVLGVAPTRGRFFTRDENTVPGQAAVAVVSDGFWRRGLASDPEVVGRTVTMNGIPFTVVGVAPDDFRGLTPFSQAPDAWIPLAMFGALSRTGDDAWWDRVPNSRSHWLQAVGRLAPGVTFEAAEANLTAASAALTYDGRAEGEGVLVTRQALYSPRQSATLSTLTRLLLGVVFMVLAIATANVAVLLLSRATTRTREMAIRTSLGAGRSRLFRQLLAESVLLGAAGGVVGVAAAYLFSDAAASLLPYTFVLSFRPDARVLAAAVTLSLLTAVVAGLAPALHAARADVHAGLESHRATTGRSRVRGALVVTQVALSLVLVAGAVLFTRSFWSARTQDLGFRTDQRLVVQVDLRSLGYSADEGQVFIARALDRIRALPGVTDVASTRMIPFQGDWSSDIEPPPGARANTEDGRIWVGMNTVSPHYFDVMGVEIVRGRPLSEEDDGTGAPAVVLNETLEDLLWPDTDGLGQTFSVGGDRSFTVVGIARDAVYYELGEEPTTQAYASVAQIYQPTVHFVLATQGRPTDWVEPAQAALREIDPALAFPWVTTLGAVFDDVTARYQVSAVLVGIFGALALLLAAAGLYGVVAFTVAQRTREIGVRMALGADRGRIAGEVLRGGLRLAGVGLVVGVAGALAVRRLTAALLFGTVRADDPLPLVAACLTLAAVAALASVAPARRATRVDPMEAIRSD